MVDVIVNTKEIKLSNDNVLDHIDVLSIEYYWAGLACSQCRRNDINRKSQGRIMVWLTPNLKSYALLIILLLTCKRRRFPKQPMFLFLICSCFYVVFLCRVFVLHWPNHRMAVIPSNDTTWYISISSLCLRVCMSGIVFIHTDNLMKTKMKIYIHSILVRLTLSAFL